MKSYSDFKHFHSRKSSVLRKALKFNHSPMEANAFHIVVCLMAAMLFVGSHTCVLWLEPGGGHAILTTAYPWKQQHSLEYTSLTLNSSPPNTMPHICINEWGQYWLR